jgi:hypothetical protein
VAPPTAAPINTTQPTIEGNSTPAPNFVCPICGGEDSGITNTSGIVEFPGTGEVLTCQELHMLDSMKHMWDIRRRWSCWRSL